MHMAFLYVQVMYIFYETFYGKATLFNSPWVKLWVREDCGGDKALI